MDISEERKSALTEIEKTLGVSFLNTSLLNQALTHSSYAHLYNLPDNERLEFLGDAVLKLAVTEHIYLKFPDYSEGDLTKIRATVISDSTLAVVARKIDLGRYLLLSPNEQRTGGEKKKSNIANAFEALIGAVYLDAGLGKARELISQFLGEEIIKVSRKGYIRDYKSALQELAQKEKGALPHYRVARETGPKHNRVFWIEVRVKGKKFGPAWGENKKDAEQRVAALALRALRRRVKPA